MKIDEDKLEFDLSDHNLLTAQFHFNRCSSRQGRKSMFKHGGDNIGEKYTSRLLDLFRGAKRFALLGGFGGMLPREFFLNGAIWCVLVYIWIRFCL